MIIDDDRAFQDGWVLLYEGDEFGDGHRIEIDVILHDDFRTAGNDVIRAVFGFGDDFHQFLSAEFLAENIDGLVRDLLIVKPLFDFSAAGARWRCVNPNHVVIIPFSNCFFYKYYFKMRKEVRITQHEQENDRRRHGWHPPL